MKYLILFIVFLLALMLRFLYFPDNTYFGFDQARDAYESLEIINGNLKVVGPPTANQVFHHGVLYYYLFAPIYLLSGGNPEAVSVFLRVLNSTGIFLVLVIVYVMFDWIAAIFASFLFAISYEQTQFSLFLNHPPFAVISVLIFYLGLSLWIFRKKIRGLILALFGLGLSIQFEFVEIQLMPIFLLFLLFFRKQLTKVNLKIIISALIAFLIPVSSYIIYEVKNNFITIRQIPNLLFHPFSGGGSGSNLSQFIFFINRHFHDNLTSVNTLTFLIEILFVVILIKLILKKIYTKQIIFLLIWFFGGLLVYFFTHNDGYFYNSGTSISILVFTSFLLSKLYHKNKILAFSVLTIILISNIYLITNNNPLGPNQRINPQVGLLLKDEKEVIDFIYQNAKGEEFAVNALTMPYNVNTTWSYLFEWYGRKKFGYVPVWGGNAAEGFSGNLKIEKARSKLPNKRFLIIEPKEGIPAYISEKFLNEEEIYARTIQKKYFGTLEVWVQEAK